MSRYQAATADFQWLLTHVAGLDEVLNAAALPDLDAATVNAMLDAAAAHITGAIAPINVASDRIGATLHNGRVATAPGWSEAYRSWREAGWLGLGAPLELGGQAMPFLIQACVATMLGGADLAFAMFAAASRAAAAVLTAHAPPALRDLCVPKLSSGEWAATIVITEPQAGSDVGLIGTKAAPAADGRYSVSGTKIFVSAGDHDLTPQILHLVLARIVGAPGGVKGLSLFLVPSRSVLPDGTLADRNRIVVSRIENKLGLHGSPTCVLTFEGADAVLIGREGAGLQTLFVMMNELRIEVALSAVGIAASATAHALEYAAERRQGRSSRSDLAAVAIDGHPDVQRMLSMMRTLTDGGRALILEAARMLDMARYGATAAERERANRRAVWLLPVCKASLSDDCVDIANLGIQVRGGHGFVKDSGAEQFLRDARVLPIYEGTNGIQAIDLVTRKLLGDRGAACQELIDDIRGDLERCADRQELLAIRVAVADGLKVWQAVSQRLLDCAADQSQGILAGASSYLALTCRVMMAWMWLRMAAVPAAQQPPDGKRELAEFFAAYYAPEFQLHAARVLRAISPLPAIQ